MGELHPESELLTIFYSYLISKQGGHEPPFFSFSFPVYNLLMLIHVTWIAPGRLFRSFWTEASRPEED